MGGDTIITQINSPDTPIYIFNAEKVTHGCSGLVYLSLNYVFESQEV